MKDMRADGENFQSLMKQKLIRDLLTESKFLLIILIVTSVNAILTLMIGLKVYGVFDKK
jgi:hypothetical protein